MPLRSSAILMVASALLTPSATGWAATTVDLTFVGFGRTREVRADLDGRQKVVWAGQLYHDISNGTGAAAALNGRHITYCTEIYQTLLAAPMHFTVAQLQETPSAPMGQIKANAIRDIYAFAGGYQFLPTASPDFTAAFQIAIWEIIADFDPARGRSSLRIDQGHLKVTNPSGFFLSTGILTQLNNIFDSIGRGLERPQLLGLSNPALQDQIVEVDGTDIPLPPAGVLGGAVLAGFFVAQRRRPA